MILLTYTRGSEWRKWDLHIHTPASYQWKGSKRFSEMSTQESNDALHKVNEAIESSDVSVFAIMDYWTLDGYKKLRNYREQKGIRATKTIFPGIELRVVSPTKHRLNMHFILSDQLSDQKLNDFKSSLKLIVGDKEPSLSDEALAEFASSLDHSKAAFHGLGSINTLTQEELYNLGAMTAEVTQKSIQTALQEVVGNAYILMPWDTYNGLEPLEFTEHTASSEFFMKISHVFESRKEDTYNLFVGKRTEQTSGFLIIFKTPLEDQNPWSQAAMHTMFSTMGSSLTEKRHG